MAPVPTSHHEIDLESQRNVSQAPNASARVGQDKLQADASVLADRGVGSGSPVITAPRTADGPSGGISDSEPEEKHTERDFDGSASELWALYRKEANSHDDARIQTLKDDMDGVLIFAGLFSAILTTFIMDSKQTLKADPTDQTTYYLQQNVAILDQISRQISSIAPQFSIPSTPPLPFPDFKPSTSDIRVNVFWFMSLIFGLAAALLATLVQKWVREYMHVFQRYRDPQKCARLRQYLYEGSEGSYMPIVAEAVPGLLHVSLFLFFVGLCDSVWNINTTVGISTIVPIGIIGLLYILTSLIPVGNPQSLYQSPISGCIWYLIQKSFRGRRYKDRNGVLRSVNSTMADGRMQLAMEETKDRKGRDGRAIQWLVSNMTEDAEMESFALAIPGSFNSEWGLEVWKEVSHDKNKGTGRNGPSRTQSVSGPTIRQTGTHTVNDSHANTAVSPPAHSLGLHSQPTTALIQREDVMYELNTRVARLLETCKNRVLFASDELWRRRARACVESTASLVCCAGVKLGQVEDIVKVLGDIGDDQKVRESSLAGKKMSYVIRWTCLSLVVIRSILESDPSTRCIAKFARKQLQRTEGGGTVDKQALTRLQKIIETFDEAFECVKAISHALIPSENLTKEYAKKRLDECEHHLSKLENINIDDNSIRLVDWSIRRVQDIIRRRTHGIITHQLPGIISDNMAPDSVQLSEYVELFRRPHTLQFVFPVWNLKRIISIAHPLRDILEQEDKWDVDAFQNTLKNLKKVVRFSTRDNPLHRQLWRLQDLSEGGGLGFTVELFFLALKQLSSTSSSIESHSALYVGTLQAITTDWRKYKHSHGTQELLLDLVVSNHNSISVVEYPADIVKKFLDLLDNILRGKIVPRIKEVEVQLTDRIRRYRGDDPRRTQCSQALVVIRRAQGSFT